MGSGRSFLAGILFVVGILAIAVGVIYLLVQAHSLPSFFPGHIAHSLGKHTKRGITAVAIGALLWIVAGVLVFSGRSRSQLR
jgi:hypothetical protein